MYMYVYDFLNLLLCYLYIIKVVAFQLILINIYKVNMEKERGSYII